jgi:hypothetical protein
MRRGNLKEKVHLGDLVVNGRIILKQMLKEWYGMGGGQNLAQDREKKWAF